MPRFTTRPELSGSYGMVATTHWLASAAAMRMLERGGNAFDAAAAAGFVLEVVEPHLNGPLGDMSLMLRRAGEDAPRVVCGQGPAPAGATIAHYRGEGLDLIPGTGLLATVIPGAFDAFLLMLRDHGALRLRDVLGPALHYAAHGHPLLARAADTIAGQAAQFRGHWPTSAATWLPGGTPPAAGELFANPELAAAWTRLIDEAETARDRSDQIEQARRSFRRGFVAEAIGDYLAEAEVMDVSGARHKGVLTASDMGRWQATYEAPVAIDHHGWTVWKCGPWSQGPAMLQALRLLETADLAALPEPAFVHTVTEALKLAFADREAYFGDPARSVIPLTALLSEDYLVPRRALIGETASTGFHPGRGLGLDALADAMLVRTGRTFEPGAGAGAGEPTMAHLAPREGDTVHIDTVDRWGNMVSATPSGGWLQSSPVIPGLGVPLNTRAQMFWLDEGLPTSLAPGRRPRTTLTPSMARGPDGTWMAFGTPGGDSQDQWQLAFFLRHVHRGLNLQEAIDAPLFTTAHLQASFYPRGTRPGHLMVEPAFGEQTISDLRARGHDVEVSEPWAVGRLTAVSRREDGLMRAAATPRLMQAYAVGR